MPEELIIQQCSPTLAGMKTGNLFTYNYESEEELLNAVKNLDRMLMPKGLRMLTLRCTRNQALIYMYRPARLQRDLKNRLADELLKECGYACKDPEHCIAMLASRLVDCTDFPHEIGLFLGYPPEDVKGFIEHKAGNCKCTGCWKVYGDEEEAQRLFEKYKACTSTYYEQWSRGKSIEQLTVAV